MGALLDSPAIAGFCDTQLTDVQQERNGLLDERRRPKVDPAEISAINGRPAAAVPVDEIEWLRTLRPDAPAKAAEAEADRA